MDPRPLYGTWLYGFGCSTRGLQRLMRLGLWACGHYEMMVQGSWDWERQLMFATIVGPVSIQCVLKEAAHHSFGVSIFSTSCDQCYQGPLRSVLRTEVTGLSRFYINPEIFYHGKQHCHLLYDEINLMLVQLRQNNHYNLQSLFDQCIIKQVKRILDEQSHILYL